MDNGESSYRRYLSGDESAFHDIVKEYFDPLVWFLHRYVRDMAAAEDLCRRAAECLGLAFRLVINEQILM